MRMIFTTLLALWMVSCGTPDESQTSDGDDNEDLEVTRVDLDWAEWADYQWLTIDPKDSGDFEEGFDWEIVVVIVKGTKAPKSCNPKDEPSGAITESEDYGEITIESGLKPETAYVLRACAFNPDRDYYSKGITKKFTTPKVESDEIDWGDEEE